MLSWGLNRRATGLAVFVRSVSGLRYPLEDAGVAQLAEQLFCKQQVTGSIPVAGSNCVFFGIRFLRS